MALKEVKIIDMILPNYSIGIDENGDKYRFKGGILGQKALVKSGKKKAGFISAKLMKILEKSELEIITNDTDPNIMTGNRFQNIPYDEELKIKSNIVNNLYKKINYFEEIKINCSPLISAYRNKMEYTFGDSFKGGPLVLGMHKVGRFYEITDYAGGEIVNEDYDKIRKFIQKFFRDRNIDYYHKTKKEGTLKFFVIRYSFYEKSFMLNLVTSSASEITQELLNEFVKEFKKLILDENKISSFYHTISDSISDAIKPDKITHIWGEKNLIEKINGLIFKISPFSFFQPNPLGAEKLYNQAIEFAGNIENKIVYDLYCGTGTISQIFAQKAKKVIGVEIVEEAVESAKKNAVLNNLQNVEFRANDVLFEIENLKDKPDIVVLDPPRAGIHQEAIPQITKMGAEKIIYISCNPVTQVEDLKIFIENGYKMEKIEAFDQFSRAFHVEALTLLVKEL